MIRRMLSSAAAAALTFALLGGGGAQAYGATPLQRIESVQASGGGTGTISQGTSPGQTTTFSSPLNFATVALQQFDTTGGILVGGRLTMVAPTIIGVSASSSSGIGVLTQLGLSVNATSPGIFATHPATTDFAGCSFQDGCESDTFSRTYLATAAIPLNSLEAYAGTGSVEVIQGGTFPLTVISTRNSVNPSGTGRFDMAIRGAPLSTTSLTYDYLNFSRPSFDPTIEQTTLNIDFGTLTQGAGLATQMFSLTNLGNAHSAGLSLTSFSRANAMSSFGDYLSPFQDLGGGASSTLGFNFDASSVGVFNESYTLNLADHAPGGVGGRTYQRTVTLTANVIAAPVAAVPEPATWALMIGGFGLAGAVLRRRRTSATA